MSSVSVFSFMCFLSVLRCSYEYSMGAPDAACADMVPGHGPSSQSSASPYDLSVDVAEVANGDKIDVVIHGSKPFMGFFLQARNVSDENDITGSFIVKDDTEMGFLICNQGYSNAVTHRNSNFKNQVVATWTPSSGTSGDIKFRATVVADYATFWTNIESAPVSVREGRSVPEAPVPPPAPNPPVVTLPGETATPAAEPEPQPEDDHDHADHDHDHADHDHDHDHPHPEQAPEPGSSGSPSAQKHQVYDGCHETKGCFGSPEGCIQTGTCKHFVSYLRANDKVRFELRGELDSYVALGLSQDLSMGDDDVTECVRMSNGDVAVFTSWNVGGQKSNRRSPQRDQETVKLLSSSVDNGVLTCAFERNARFTHEDVDFDLLNNEYVLLVASGSAQDSNIGYHTKGKVWTGQPARLTSVSPVGSYSLLFVRLHGAFMVAAWIGAASCGILLARYFKKTWVGSQCCGKDLWFVFHRFFMVLTWVLTVAGVVLMLVELKGLSAIPIDKNPHALLGGISTILCFLNPFMALCRPAPDAKSRPIFNWSHWFVGNAAQILGIVAIFYAIELPKASLPTWMNWVVVAFVAFHVLAHLALSLHMFSSSREQRQHEMYAMREIGMSNSPMYMEGKLEPKGGSFRRTMLGLYLVINWLFTAVLVVIVVLAPIEDYLKNWSLK